MARTKGSKNNVPAKVLMSIRLDPDINTWLREESIRTGKTVTQIIEESLTLAKEEPRCQH